MKVGDRLVVNGRLTTATWIGPEWLEVATGRLHNIATGHSHHGAAAYTPANWQRRQRAEAARDALRLIGISLAAVVDAVLVYEALRPVFALPPLPALESFEVPK